MMDVSIHALTKSATFLSLQLVVFCSFNPRTHEECDLVGVRIVLQLCSFQSTHSRRVRPRRRLIKKPRPGFNPRTHEECDAEPTGEMEYLVGVSIHALTKSATRCNKMATTAKKSFNPRTHEECDGPPLFRMRFLCRFQSTHSRRVRLSGKIRFVRFITVSIHALTKSATLLLPTIIDSRQCFNPRTHEECDCIYFFSLISRYLEQCFRESS